MTVFRFRPDPDSPVPVFHQIAMAIRYRIATGRLRPGQSLPSIRDAAEELNVHYLTVRKAYGKLRHDGLVESRRGRGTWVLGSGQLADALRSEGAGPLDGEETDRAVHVVECNRPQALDYARQLRRGTGMPAGTWLLTGEGEPPAGLLVGTYFHFHDLRERWPERVADMHFVAVAVDPELRHRAHRAIGDASGRIRVCETRPSRAHNVLPDVRSLFRDTGWTVDTLLVDRPATALQGTDGDPVLFSPRLWAKLDDSQRDEPRSLLLRYVIDPTDLAELRERFGARGSGSETVAA